MNKLLLTTILLLSVWACFAQDKPGIKDLELTPEQKAQFTATVPITYGKKDDGYPDTVKVRGVVKGISGGLIALMCGVTCYSSIVEIKLDKKLDGYNSDHIYVAIVCPFNFLKKNDRIELKAAKIYKPSEEGCEDIINIYDTGNVPVYRAKSGSIMTNGKRPG